MPLGIMAVLGSPPPAAPLDPPAGLDTNGSRGNRPHMAKRIEFPREIPIDRTLVLQNEREYRAAMIVCYRELGRLDKESEEHRDRLHALGLAALQYQDRHDLNPMEEAKKVAEWEYDWFDPADRNV